MMALLELDVTKALAQSRRFRRGRRSGRALRQPLAKGIESAEVLG
jgi:hypothetical protein